ncbi:hypothetical protein GEV33_004145 [Tenebrio molitor]|uniref:Uncharacterized protein n=1 Tax=Tenebrio molitor TaxID=7067 RepID=A0A8J6LN02_TENMO|nr:hypothetical protein GEV33_004145 [Tenebrio molitor]
MTSSPIFLNGNPHFFLLFYNLLVVTLGLKSIQLRVNYNKTALVAANSPTITIAPINRKTPGPASAPKKPTFSVVVRDVPQDISAEEIAALYPPLSIVKAWRIVSRKSNRFTSFIRVLSTDKLTVDYMLINGIVLYGRTFECKTSHPPTPTPLQCPRCFQFGHGQAECTNKAICPKCPESHPPNRCPAKEPSCSSCNGPHPAWSRACPSFKQILVTDETPVLPVKIIDPPTAIAEPTDSDSDLENRHHHHYHQELDHLHDQDSVRPLPHAAVENSNHPRKHFQIGFQRRDQSVPLRTQNHFHLLSTSEVAPKPPPPFSTVTHRWLRYKWDA